MNKHKHNKNLKNKSHNEGIKAFYIPVFEKENYSEIWATEINNEIISLSKAANIEIINSSNIINFVIKKINPKYFISSGKINEILEIAKEYHPELFILNIDISPSQQKNLTSILGHKIISKTELIYEIFINRANSAISQIQVELANLKYIKSRLVGSYDKYDRIRGGIGIKGSGEKKLELDRRNLEKRISFLNKKLKKYETHFHTIYKNREHISQISIVGYTNAGKTSLLNKLSHAKQEAKNLLFSTVNTKSKKFYLGNGKYTILSDTIGFIRDLPHNLVDSFKTTLLEIKYSNLLLIVVDSTSDFINDHLKIVFDTLKEIKCDKIPYILVFNKIDLIKNDYSIILNSLKKQYKDAFFISTKTGEGIEELKVYLKNFFKNITIA